MRFEIDTFQLALGPARNAQRSWAPRRGLLVRLRGHRGVEGWGEASPLPGFSAEDLPTTAAFFDAWQQDEVSLELEHAHAVEAIEAHLRGLPKVPSARFALESALLDIAAKCAGTSVRSLLCNEGSRGRDVDELAMLLGPATAIDWTRVDAGLSAGFETFKVKVGARESIETELTELARLRHRVGSGVNIRVDANGELGSSAAALDEALARLADIEVEVLEEPVAGKPLLQMEPSRVPLAIDESLLEIVRGKMAWRDLERSSINVVVLKPMLLGGLLACRRHALWATATGREWIVSHLFDGPVAMAGYCSLVRSLPESRLAMGLAPHAGLAANKNVTVDGLSTTSLRDSNVPGLPFVGDVVP